MSTTGVGAVWTLMKNSKKREGHYTVKYKRNRIQNKSINKEGKNSGRVNLGSGVRAVRAGEIRYTGTHAKIKNRHLCTCSDSVSSSSSRGLL